MEIYHGFGGDSGVSGYEIGDDYIKVQFTSGAQYLYTYSATGIVHVNEMKQLARSGSGLNGYINRYAKYAYAK